MSPADPRDVREPDPFEDEGPASAPESAPGAEDLETLRARADVPALLALARASRSGEAPGGRDMRMCLEAYRAAAELGNVEAELAVAMFHMSGAAIGGQDLKEGTMRLRAAAEKGSVPAKVYLGNLYELGIHYKADPEKADVWYRNAGRAAKIEAEPGSPAYDRALAELGCARHVLALSGDPAVDESDKSRLLARARVHGYGLRIREAGETHEAPPTAEEREAAEERAGPGSAAPGAPSAAPPIPAASAAAVRARKDTSPETKGAKQRLEEAAAQARAARRAHERRTRMAAALGAFGYAVLFAVAGIGAGYAATLGARELVAQGRALPLVGTNARLVFPLLLAVVGVLPAWLVYRLGAVAKALGMAAVLGGVGWVAWGTGTGALHADRALQALAFGLAGFLAALLVLGLLGGAKPPRAAGGRRETS